jgi:DNA-binding NarL/FixJ family response regulator
VEPKPANAASTGYRILVGDREPLVRLGLRVLLGEDQRLTVVGEAQTAMEVLSYSRRLQPDLALIEAGLLGLDGLETIRTLSQVSPHTRVLILCDEALVDADCSALVPEAAGSVPRSVSHSELRRAVSAVLASDAPGRGALPPPPADVQSDADASGLLSARELEVLVLVAQGRSNTQIAKMLTISPSTAKSHVEHILRKLGVKGRTGAAVKAAQLGLIGPIVQPSAPDTPVLRSAVA